MLFWGGLRGALALALALGLPPEVAQREEIIKISFCGSRLFRLRTGPDYGTVPPPNGRDPG